MLTKTYLHVLLMVIVLLTAGHVRSANAGEILVHAGDDFQAKALNAPVCGDTVIVDEGATFDTVSQPFMVPKFCDVNNPIIVRTSNLSALALDERGRVRNGNGMFRIRATTAYGALMPAKHSSGWHFIGMEVTGTGNAWVARLINTATPQGGSDDPATWGNNFIFDRCYIHPPEDGTTNYTRTADVGFGWNAGSITVINSRLSGFGGVDKSGQVIASGAFWSNVGGPYF